MSIVSLHADAAFRKRVVNKTFPRRHISPFMRKNANNCNLVQLLVWWDEESLSFDNNRIVLKDHPHCFIYPEASYDSTTGLVNNVMKTLEMYFKLDFSQAFYVAEFFSKIMKQPQYYLKIAIEQYCTERYGDLDDLPDSLPEKNPLLVFLEQDLYTPLKDHHAYDRTFAYLQNSRCIDKTLILNMIRQKYLVMDSNYNLCFIRYQDNRMKQPLAVIQHGTSTQEPFSCCYSLKRNQGFLYAFSFAKKFKALYVFCDCIDLLSFLTLYLQEAVEIEDIQHSCFLTINGENSSCIESVLQQYPDMKKLYSCMPNYYNNDRMFFQNQKISKLSTINFRLLIKEFNRLYSADAQTWNDVLCLTCKCQKFKTEQQQNYELKQLKYFEKRSKVPL